MPTRIFGTYTYLNIIKINHYEIIFGYICDRLTTKLNFLSGCYLQTVHK